MLADYRIKLQELQFSIAASQDRDVLLSDLEISYDNAVEQKYHQTITQIDSSIQTLQSELISAQSNLKVYQIANSMYQSNVDENGVPVSISLATMEQISSLLTQQETLATKLNDLNTQIQQIEEKISQGSIVAEQGGIVSVITTLVKGDSIAAGTQVATIIPPSESEYKVQLYVSNSDIANISVGDEVKFSLSALPSNQYGMVSGKVTRISADALVQNGQFSGYYLVECSIANVERMYSYVTIMISSLNCIYDACSRISNTPCAKKKLLLIICGAGTAFLYCLYIVCTIPLENMQWRCDYFLLVYSLVFIIALKEIAPCIAKIIK